jgi:glucosamine-6-phosphate deaminase
MRTTALPSMLEVIARNYNFNNANVKLFEIATVYIPTTPDALPNENKVLTAGIYGNCDFYTMKGICENILKLADIKNYSVVACTNNASYHPGRCAKITVDNKELGIFGEVHPLTLKNYDIEWNRINVFHMDEYVGLSIEKQQSFARFIKKMVVDKFPVGSFNAINGANLSAEEECKRYAKLLKENPIDVVCCGIGENGHLAFNDPCNADFFDIESVKTVELDQLCRKQQVNDGCFEKIQDVPTRAITVTMPALLRAKEIICVVPAKSKANAIWSTLKKSIDTSCPASILRIHNNAYLYCDKDSASKI